jgi:hypothetical protein
VNTSIQTIFNDDQKDRRNPIILNNRSLFKPHDKVRKDLVRSLLQRNEIDSAKDYYMAAMIFHHGTTIQDSKKAVALAKKSTELGYKKALAFYATCLDRLLVRQGKKQKFGTQYFKKNSKSPWKLLLVDPKVTDKERKKYGLPTLNEMKKRIKELNKKRYSVKNTA